MIHAKIDSAVERVAYADSTGEANVEYGILAYLATRSTVGENELARGNG